MITAKLTGPILFLFCCIALVVFFLTVQTTAVLYCVGFCGSALVSVSSVTCANDNGTLMCDMMVLNTGTVSVAVTDCAIMYGSSQSEVTQHGVTSGSTTLAPQNMAQRVTCRISDLSLPAGTSFEGSLRLSNGASALFAGTI